MGGTTEIESLIFLIVSILQFKSVLLRSENSVQTHRKRRRAAVIAPRHRQADRIAPGTASVQPLKR